MLNSVINIGIYSGILAIVIWVISILIIRTINFSKNGERLTSIRGGNERFDQIKYHNEAIYRDFEYFYKVTLAILGGIAFVATHEKTKIDIQIMIPLLKSASLIQLVVAFILSLFIFFHQKSKIERWNERFNWYQTLVWQECWIIVSIFSISGSISIGAIPEIVDILSL